MREASKKVSDGKMVKVRVDGEDVSVLGDFFMHPEEKIVVLEEVLEDVRGDGVDAVRIALEEFMDEEGVELFGVSAGDIAEVYMEVMG